LGRNRHDSSTSLRQGDLPQLFPVGLKEQRRIVDTHMYKCGHVQDPRGGGCGCLVRGKLWKSPMEPGVID
jgi:hypothetical protein